MISVFPRFVEGLGTHIWMEGSPQKKLYLFQ